MSLLARAPRLCPTCSRLPPALRRDLRPVVPPSSPPPRSRRLMQQLSLATESNQTETAVSGLKGLRSRCRPPWQKTAADDDAPTRTIFGQSADVPIRARFAPSPTGFLHLGSLRTALFNYLAARASKGGAFILRIEDTDQSRRVPFAEEHLFRDLRWAGLAWDEGPDCGGPHGPYRQSERLSIYKAHVGTLLKGGHAYRCFCTPEQITSQRHKLHEQGMSTDYPGTCRAIDSSESLRRAESGEPHVVRFKSHVNKRPGFRDAVYGLIQKKSADEDFILLKSDGFPTYHLANVVDDHLMAITHVIRGEEWLVSTSKHLALYHAFGWKPPTFAHLGLLVDLDGSKLSKRLDSDGIMLAKYQHGVVFPVALLSWLANLGSSFEPRAPTPRIVDHMADALTFKFTKGGIKLNYDKLNHFQAKYREMLLRRTIPKLTRDETKLLRLYLINPLVQEFHDIHKGNTNEDGVRAMDSLPAAWQTTLEPIHPMQRKSHSSLYAKTVMTALLGRHDSPQSLVHRHPYLFWRVPLVLYQASLRGTPERELRHLERLWEAIDRGASWHGGAGSVERICEALGEDDARVVHNVLRLVATGERDAASPSSAEMLRLLGKEEWRHRVIQTINAWPSTQQVSDLASIL